MVAAAALVTSTGSSSTTTANAPTAATYLDDDMHNSFFSLGAIPWHTIDLVSCSSFTLARSVASALVPGGCQS
ncbi:BQ5605_C024g09915 [Microbotryum silenes-dioicae]|uniref:BQ5605_C024g09915 protein n=1 Tax=Microbotryum silenes-dioicae TaxID=796604 RepID=A0A2X0MM13_9BASI|nr:BQ5605_C024g09915 [Microbotryum silenes-dioicae]